MSLGCCLTSSLLEFFAIFFVGDVVADFAFGFPIDFTVGAFAFLMALVLFTSFFGEAAFLGDELLEEEAFMIEFFIILGIFLFLYI